MIATSCIAAKMRAEKYKYRLTNVRRKKLLTVIEPRYYNEGISAQQLIS